MRGYVANTDYEWFTFLRAIEPPIDEVNFWMPKSEATFRAVAPGEPIFFKLKAPHNAIGGFGYFAHFSRLPVSMVWQVYGQANGAASYAQMRERLVRIRTRFDRHTDPKQEFWIGCILVNYTSGPCGGCRLSVILARCGTSSRCSSPCSLFLSLPPLPAA